MALKTIRIYEKYYNVPLNWITDHFLEEKSELVSRLSEFHSIEAPTVQPDGRSTIVEIIIRYENLSEEDLEAINQILERAQASADDIIVTYEDS